MIGIKAGSSSSGLPAFAFGNMMKEKRRTRLICRARRLFEMAQAYFGCSRYA
jgi:hypothetical protein